ncbi:universal stress protein [Planosporangium thailandense]|uniref:Universal stress protein n=1 Tax=Planosporangium thailandense TaxID=765197 RepID=A0ABX0Y2Z1_9ACTN|nr:universal stress protein [Planosporangium thailandense]NJC72446.1 universal stress protein [Planosporangium thailandense]
MGETRIVVGVDGSPAGAAALRWAAARLHRELTDELAGWREKYPDVDVDYDVAVGSRGRGGFDGPLLGSVGPHLLRHADCPVLIARTRS